MNQNALVVQGLAKTYDGFALKDVSFRVPSGAIVGLIGENGAGKTTTLHAILGLIDRDAGDIEILGERDAPMRDSLRGQIGVVFDGNNFPDALTPRNVVRVLPGERVPVDGVVCSGTCTVDASALTGAARPVEKAVGDAVLAGTLNRAGSAFITPTAIGDATVLQRTIAALQRAQTVRTPEQVRLERAASRLTALLVLLAIGVGVVWLFWRQPGDLARALTCTCAVLAATCPGAAGQAAGVAAPAEIGRAAERGELLTCGAEASAARTARTVRRGIWLLLAYHAVCLPLAACGVIGPGAAAVLACGASGGVLLCALRGNETKGERP